MGVEVLGQLQCTSCGVGRLFPFSAMGLLGHLICESLMESGQGRRLGDNW